MNFWQWAYKNQYADKEDLRAAVALNDLTTEEYKQLTDEVYKSEQDGGRADVAE